MRSVWKREREVQERDLERRSALGQEWKTLREVDSRARVRAWG